MENSSEVAENKKAEPVEDIYSLYKATEHKGQVHDYMDSQPDIDTHMRAILMEWLVEVYTQFKLLPEILFLTLNIVDRFLSVHTVSRTKLQLVGIAAMFIASKYEDTYTPTIYQFVEITDNSFSQEEFVMMEEEILRKLDWILTYPTPCIFLNWYVNASEPLDEEFGNLAFSVAVDGVMHYPIVVRFSPSMVAAVAVYVARRTLKKKPSWTETLKQQSGYSKDQLKDCVKMHGEYCDEFARRHSSGFMGANAVDLCKKFGLVYDLLRYSKLCKSFTCLIGFRPRYDCCLLHF